MGDRQDHGGRDFFVSYTRADEDWAVWIAWQLEAAGYATLLQAWDFGPGRDWVHEMDQATATATRTIAVLSPAYLQSVYAKAEWQAVFRQDPTGKQGLLIPVRVERVDPPGLLAARVYVDLVGKDDETARQALLAAIEQRRAKPSREPRFPGGESGLPVHAPTFPGRRFPSVRFLLVLAVAAVLVGAGLGWIMSKDRAGPFRDNFADRSNGWEVIDDAKHRLRYVDGIYQMLTKQPGDYYSFPRSRHEQLSTLKEVVVEVDARKRSGTKGNGYGVICRYQPAGDLYWFNITNDGYYGINKKIRGRTVRLQPPARTDAIGSTGFNHIQATCTRGGDSGAVKLALKVNGRQIAEATDDEDPLPAGGGVGLFAHNRGDGPADFVFDNFVAREA